MAKLKNEGEKIAVAAKAKESQFPAWQLDPGTYIAGREEIDDLDLVAIEMERKWGCDRLRTLVAKELREKFDRQRYLTNQAIWHGDLQAVRREAKRMIAGWRALDRAAEAAGAPSLSAEVWECVGKEGAVYALVRGPDEARMVVASGRHTKVYTLDEIAHLLDGFPELAVAKEVFPGAQAYKVRTSVSDPLHGLPDSKEPLDDPVPF